MELRLLPAVSPHLLCLLAVSVLLAAAAEVPLAASAPACRRICGDIVVPFPFGLDRSDCAIHPDFLLDCTRKNGADKLYHHLVNLEVIRISVPDGKVWLRNFISHQCYNETTAKWDDPAISWMNLTGSSFIISAKDNSVFGIGCRTYPVVVTNSYIAGCTSFCCEQTPPRNGSCSGAGCCEAALSKSTKIYEGAFLDYTNTTRDIWKQFPCNYVSIRETVNFSSAPLVSLLQHLFT